MGSLDINGQPINKDYNRVSIKNQGFKIKSTNSLTDTESLVSNSGVLRTTNLGLIGVVFASGTVKTEGMTLTERGADNSVNRRFLRTMQQQVVSLSTQ
jgi:hypothetical protein